MDRTQERKDRTMGKDGLVAGAPGARDLPLAMTPGTERRAGEAAPTGAAARPPDPARVEEQGPFLAPNRDH